MELGAVIGLVLLLIAAGKGVQKVVDLIVAGFPQLPKWSKIALSFVVPALGVYLGDVDPTSFGLRGPDVVLQVVIVTAIGGFAAFWHETDELTRAKAEAERAKARI